MPTPLLICDDSRMARRQMARVLPEAWNVEVTYAENGAEALAAAAQGHADVMLLDLTMPVMDGYQTLEALRDRGLESQVIVVSGDVQAAARQRVEALGALDFLAKPVDAQRLRSALERHGLLIGGGAAHPPTRVEGEAGLVECCQEVANVATGRAAAMLAELLGVFVVLPVPNVNVLEVGELHMALRFARTSSSVSAVCQGFIGAGIAGEALLVFNDVSFAEMAELMGFEGEIDERMEAELIMDTANVLVGACLKGIADQLDVTFHRGPPTVLGRQGGVDDLIEASASRWRRTLAIEVTLGIEGRDFTCDLLLLVAEDSIPALRGKLAFLDA